MAVIVFGPAPVDAMVPVIWPAPLVTPPGWVIVFPLPLAARLTVCPETGTFAGSRTVIVIV